MKCENYIVDDHDGTVNAENLLNWVNTTFPTGWSEKDAQLEGKTAKEAAELITARVREMYEKKVSGERPDYVDQMERQLMLQAIDKMWQRHINDMDALREGVRLRAQGQRDPLVEYKREAYGLFETLMQDIQLDMLSRLFRSTTNLSAFEEFLASLPVADSDADPTSNDFLNNGDLLTVLRDRMRLMHERERQAMADADGQESLSGALPEGVAMQHEKKISLPSRKNRLVNIRSEKNKKGKKEAKAPVFDPQDPSPSL